MRAEVSVQCTSFSFRGDFMRTRLFAFAILLIAISIPGWSQTFGDISGEVRDTSGAAIPGVQLTITNVATGASRSVVTNEVGLYSVPALPPGTYTVKAEKTGFKSVTRPDRK